MILTKREFYPQITQMSQIFNSTIFHLRKSAQSADGLS